MYLIKTILATAVLLLLALSNVHAEKPAIVMVYKDSAKPPLIGDLHDNSGVYVDMFSQAATAIGYRLEVKRLPKKRVYLHLEEGSVDFYPGSSFSNQRSDYLIFLENGLQTKEVLVSRAGHTDVQSLEEIQGTLLVDLGGSKEKISERYPAIDTLAVASLDFEQSLSLISLKRVDYYIADIEEVDSFAAKMGIDSFSDIGIKIHQNALGGFQAMYMGFSQHSPLMELKKNPTYDQTKPLSYENTPMTASENSVAYQFHKALMSLRADGTLNKYINEHTVKSTH